MAMPRRPRSHVVGDEAVDAFTRLFRPWVVRETGRSDYGVDAEVEVFDNEGKATGYTFKAQIKGSDTAPKSKNTVNVNVSTMSYWRAHDVPVLVFLFLTKSGSAYARWAHSYDPQIELTRPRSRSRPSSQKVPFRFEAQHVVTESTRRRIQSELRAVREIRDRAAIKSLPVFAQVDVDDLADEDIIELEGRIAQMLRQSARVFHPINLEDPAGCSLTIRRHSFEFVMPARVASINVVHNCNLAIATERRDLLRLITVAAATQLAALRIDSSAAALLDRVSDFNAIGLEPSVLYSLCELYLRQRRVDDAMRLAMAALRTGEAWTIELLSVVLMPIVFGWHGHLSETVAKQLLRDLDQITDRHYYEGNETIAAELSYLQAQMWRTLGDADRAILYFRQTADINSMYLSLSHFHREMGGAYAEAGNYHVAAAHYARSKECGNHEPDIDFVHADALLMAGRYEEAILLAQSESEDEKIHRDRMLIISLISGWAVHDARVRRQPRHQLIDCTLSGLPSYDDSKSVMRVLASTDLLDIRLLTLALEATSEKEELRAFSIGIAIAWLKQDDCWSWVWALLEAIRFSVGEQLVDIIADYCVFTDEDGEMLDEAIDATQRIFGDATHLAVRAIVGRRRGVNRLRERKQIVRLVDPESGQVDTFDVTQEGI